MNNYKCENSNVVVGNSVDIDMKNKQLGCSSEIRSDIMVEEFNAKRIWGQVVNCNNMPIANCLVKLVKICCENGRNYYQGIAHTITNCEGFYQFDICADDCACYKIIVNKATTGAEAIIDNKRGNCNACSPNNNCGSGGGYNPCNPCNEEHVIPPMYCNCNEPKQCNNAQNMNMCYDSNDCYSNDDRGNYNNGNSCNQNTRIVNKSSICR